MTRQRTYGEDTPFGAWLRRQPALSSTHFVASDVDWVLHRYRLDEDKVGTRDLNFMMLLETKTHGARLNSSQQETLWFQHQLLKRSGQLRLIGARAKRAVWSFGVSVLVMDGESPACGGMVWARFRSDGSLSEKCVSEQQLIQLFRFDLHPDSLKPMIARRHHKTREMVVCEKTQLGFYADRVDVHRS